LFEKILKTSPSSFDYRAHCSTGVKNQNKISEKSDLKLKESTKDDQKHAEGQ
jgi:hypothetical protein